MDGLVLVEMLASTTTSCSSSTTMSSCQTSHLITSRSSSSGNDSDRITRPHTHIVIFFRLYTYKLMALKLSIYSSGALRVVRHPKPLNSVEIGAALSLRRFITAALAALPSSGFILHHTHGGFLAFSPGGFLAPTLLSDGKCIRRLKATNAH